MTMGATPTIASAVPTGTQLIELGAAELRASRDGIHKGGAASTLMSAATATTRSQLNKLRASGGVRSRGSVAFLTYPLPSLTSWEAASSQPIERGAGNGPTSFRHEPNFRLR